MPKLKHSEILTLDEAFNTGQGAGYVLNFSDRTFAAYFDEEFGIDIDEECYRVNGGSKGKRLKTLLTIEDGITAAKVLRVIWDERSSILARRGDNEAPGLADRYFQVVQRLHGDQTIARTDVLESFVRSETLDELVLAIQRDINANKPQAALDRLHTYCMKKFGHLIEIHGGQCEREDPLHSRVGKYLKLIEPKTTLQPISLRIMKSSISIFDEFNNIRNNNSFAHDNEIVGLHEARFIFDAISNVLRFFRSVEASRFGG